MKRICPIHGLHSERSCPKCFAARERREKQRHKRYDATKRDMESKSFYDSAAWRKTRKMVLKREPLCRMCGKPATIVDHIIPIREGGKRLDASNLQPLCHACHNQKTMADRKGRGGS